MARLNPVEQQRSDDRKASSLPKAFLAGAMSGTCSAVLFQPLDLVKTRLQSGPLSTAGPVRAASMIHVAAAIVRQEHLAGLWRGFTPTLARTVPGVGLYFCSVQWLGQVVAEGSPKAHEAAFIGLAARTFSASALIPFTVVKTRFESGAFGYRGVGQALTSIWHQEGVRGLTCGLLPTIVRDAPFSAIYLMFYTQTKNIVPQELLKGDLQAPLTFSCGVVAGIAASLATQPADVVKTKMQLYPETYPNIKSVLCHLHKKYGFRGYFKGLVPRMLRRTLNSAMAWTVYEQISRSVGLK